MPLRIFARQIGVDQPQGGENYPFVLPTDDLSQLIGDLHLSYCDPQGALSAHLPLKIKWLSGFGTNVVADPTGRTRSHELLIVNDDDETVFDSRDYDTLQETAWGTQYLILEWFNAATLSTEATYQVLRVVKYVTPPSGETLVWDTYFEPTNAELDARAAARIPPLVRTISVVTDPEDPGADVTVDAGQNVVFQAGYNMLLETEALETADGDEQGGRIRLSAVPGTGIGRYPCEAEVLVKHINGTTADALGTLLLDTTGCYRLERATTGTGPVSIVPNTLKLSNDCGPCCECQDFINVYEAIRRLINEYNALGLRAEGVRDQYRTNLENWNEEREVRLRQPLRLVSQSLARNKVAIAFGICNNTDRPMTDVELRLCFNYGPDPEGVEAVTLVPGCPMPFSTYMVGNTEPGIATPCKRLPYELLGSWPRFSAHFDCIDPDRTGAVSTVFDFRDGVYGQQVEMVLRAFGVLTASAGTAFDSVSLLGFDAVFCCSVSSGSSWSSQASYESSLCGFEEVEE